MKNSIVMIRYVKKESFIRDIVMNILRECQLIQYEGEFFLNIYNINLDLQQLSYIEDSLKEYMNDNSNLIIKQLTNKNRKEKVFFSLACKI